MSDLIPSVKGRPFCRRAYAVYTREVSPSAYAADALYCEALSFVTPTKSTLWGFLLIVVAKSKPVDAIVITFKVTNPRMVRRIAT